MDHEAVLETLNRIMEFELAGVVRYTHYALMVFGFNRIPIVSWMQQQAEESLAH
jgi:bacterioferritin